jgi:molecular chaperone GrpE
MNDQENQDQGQAADAVFTGAVEVEGLKHKLAETEKLRDEYLAMAKGVRAEFENYQKRQQRDLQQERRYAQAPFAGDLLPVLDNLDRALEAAAKAGDNSALTQGVRMVMGQFIEILKRHGISRMECVDKPFDPNHHEAVTQIPSADHAPQTVLQAFEQGWLLHDRVLRPAKVAISG